MNNVIFIEGNILWVDFEEKDYEISAWDEAVKLFQSRRWSKRAAKEREARRRRLNYSNKVKYSRKQDKYLFA